MDSYLMHMAPEELYIDPVPPLNVRICPRQEAAFEMYEKYKITDPEVFIKSYIEFGCSRTPEQVISGEMILPPGCIDKKHAYRECQECIEVLNIYTHASGLKRSEINAMGTKVAKGGATLQEKELLGFRTNEYVSLTHKACMARRRLWEISGLNPIDGAQFNKDMLWYQRVFLSDRFSSSGYPDLSVASL